MKSLLTVFSIFIYNILLAQAPSIVTPHYARDSVTIKGRVIDDSGNPVNDAFVLFYPFHLKKYDVTWYEKDTILSDTQGYFEVRCTKQQFFNNHLYINKPGYFTAIHFFQEIPSYIVIDTPIILHVRKTRRFDTKKVNQNILGMTVGQSLDLFKLDISQSRLMEIRNSDSVHAKALRIEAADSSMILLIVNYYSDPLNDKLNILTKRIIGVGLAFSNGEKRFLGNAIQYRRKVYNEYVESNED